MTSNKPGRSCPLHYRYSPTVFAGTSTILADTLYVVGGLYGNPFALETVVDMAEREKATWKRARADEKGLPNEAGQASGQG